MGEAVESKLYTGNKQLREEIVKREISKSVTRFGIENRKSITCGEIHILAGT